MTRKDYEAMARAIACKQCSQEEKARIASEFVAVLQTLSDRFNGERFLRACLAPRS